MVDVGGLLYAAAGLSLAVAVGYLFRASSLVRSFFGLPADDDRTDDDDVTCRSRDAAGGCCHERPPTAHAATQTVTDHVTPPVPVQLSSDSSSPHQNHVTPSPPSSPSPPLTSSRPSSATKVLEKQVKTLEDEIERFKQVVGKMESENCQLRDRLAEQAESRLTKGPSKFEDLSLGEHRPSMLIKRYGDLYSENRIEAWDDLDLLPEEILDEDKEKLLFSIVVLCFREAQRSHSDRLRRIRESILSSTGQPRSGREDLEDATPQLKNLMTDVEDSVESYLRRTVSRCDLTNDLSAVTGQLWSKLVDYPSLSTCPSLVSYIDACLRIAWSLTIQNPSYVIEFDDDVFNDDRHTRFHSSDSESDRIRSFLWPALVEKTSGFCVAKAVVSTGQ